MNNSYKELDSYQKLKELIRELNEATLNYDKGSPTMSDKEWDDKYFELQKLEKETNIILNNSPTQTISYEVVNELSKKEHNHKMLSLDKTKSIDEVINFMGDQPCLAMLKMDGLTCSLMYQNGKLVSAETRGNGIIGEDILHNAKVIPSIPKQIPYKETLVVDGEIICTYKDFEPFSSEYKNPRNFAAGSIRLLNSKECAARSLTFVAWDVIKGYDGEALLHSKLLSLNAIGFTIVPFLCMSTLHPIDEDIECLKREAKEYGYPIDGIVFKYNLCEYGRSLGETSHHFKNAIAYKFYDETYSTHLLDIEWTMGRTSVLTPVAVFEPVEIEGSTVERASLHNLSIMAELFGPHGPYIGQEIETFKANQIIPQVASAKWSEGKNKNRILIPNACPICGGPVSVRETEGSTFLVCDNSNCEGKLINIIEHFLSKKGLDAKGISKATLEKLIDWGWVSCFTDIFELSTHRAEWIRQPGFGIKSVDKILEAVAASSHCNLSQFIAALGIPLIGTTASKELANYFKTWSEFINAIESNFSFYTLPNFGTEMHSAIVNYNYAEAKLLVEHYIHFNEVKESTSSEGADLSGKTFVVTGKLNSFKNRDELKSLIESLGGKVTGSVSKKTDYLLNNDVGSSSSKNLTAKSLGIPILSEEDFISTFGISI